MRSQGRKSARRRHTAPHKSHSPTMSSSMCVIETSSAGREYKVRDMAQADFGYVRRSSRRVASRGVVEGKMVIRRLGKRAGEAAGSRARSRAWRRCVGRVRARVGCEGIRVCEMCGGDGVGAVAGAVGRRVGAPIEISGSRKRLLLHQRADDSDAGLTNVLCVCVCAVAWKLNSRKLKCRV